MSDQLRATAPRMMCRKRAHSKEQPDYDDDGMTTTTTRIRGTNTATARRVNILEHLGGNSCEEQGTTDAASSSSTAGNVSDNWLYFTLNIQFNIQEGNSNTGGGGSSSYQLFVRLASAATITFAQLRQAVEAQLVPHTAYLQNSNWRFAISGLGDGCPSQEQWDAISILVGADEGDGSISNPFRVAIKIA